MLFSAANLLDNFAAKGASRPRRERDSIRSGKLRIRPAIRAPGLLVAAREVGLADATEPSGDPAFQRDVITNGGVRKGVTDPQQTTAARDSCASSNTPGGSLNRTTRIALACPTSQV